MARKTATGKKKTAGASDRHGSIETINPFVSAAWLDFMTERTRFATRRLQHDLEWQRAILACRTPMELMEVQSEFIKVAATQYAEEIARLWATASKASAGMASEARASHARGYDDVPL